MAKKRSKKQSRRSSSKKASVKPVSRKPVEWLRDELVGIPRYVRLLLVFLMSVGVTLATFPLLTWFFRLIAWVTGNPDLVLNYTFTEQRSELNSVLIASLVVGAVYYFIGWRIYIGIVGDTPLAHNRVVWYFGVGIISTLLGATWVVTNVLIGGAPAV